MESKKIFCRILGGKRVAAAAAALALCLMAQGQGGVPTVSTEQSGASTEQSGASTEQSGALGESGNAQSSVSAAYPSDIDSVEFSLLTCAPGHEVYTVYGHTAIRMNDKRQNGRDLAFNYGIFSFKKKFFVLRFIMGLTDYELAAWPTRVFLEDYKKEGRQVIEQPLNLTALEKARLMAALFDNCREENRPTVTIFFTITAPRKPVIL